MRLRSFTAPTVREAMRQVRDAMGADAIIVATHRSERGRGVRVTAALDHPDEDRRLQEELARPRVDCDGRLARTLAWHGAPAELGRDLGGEDLSDALSRRFSFADLDEGGKPLMLVGPPGAGKTTGVAKLATRAALADATAFLVTTDTVRAGAVAQLDAFAAVLGQPLHSAHSPEELRAALLALRGSRRRVLIDTPGANPFDAAEMDDLRRFIAVGEV
jgi:flagellar biosynthesis protein FlhF